MTSESRIQQLLVDRPTALVPRGDSRGYDVVFGAGGIKGYAHIGAKQALDDLRVPLRVLRGVSAGADNATLIANGRTPRQMLELNERERLRVYTGAAWQEFYKETIESTMCALSGDPKCSCELQEIVGRMQAKMLETFNFWQRALVMPTPMQWMKSQSVVSLEAVWQDVIDREKLVPTDNLEIVAYCLVEGRPLFYRGSHYNLAKAVSGSGSLPGVFVPVQDGHHLIGDGAMYHYNPTVDLGEPAIVIRLGRAKSWPSEPLSPIDAYFHWREMNLPLMPTAHDVDESRHIVVDVPCADLAGLSFGISRQRRLQLIEEGYDVTFATISKEIEQGRIIIPGHSA